MKNEMLIIEFKQPPQERELYAQSKKDAQEWMNAIRARQRWLKERRKAQLEKLNEHRRRMRRFAGHVRYFFSNFFTCIQSYTQAHTNRYERWEY